MHKTPVMDYCAVLVLLLGGGCSSSTGQISIDPKELVECVTNADVVWDGSLIGLNPRLHGMTQLLAGSKGRQHREELTLHLLRRLHDAEAAVAAHVILSELYDMPWRTNAGQWCGLGIELRADGSTQIHPEETDALYERWHDHLRGIGELP